MDVQNSELPWFPTSVISYQISLTTVLLCLSTPPESGLPHPGHSHTLWNMQGEESLRYNARLAYANLLFLRTWMRSIYILMYLI